MTAFVSSSASPTPAPHSRLKLAALLGACALGAGCATVSQPTPGDPLESANRGIFAFNEAVDGAVLKPITLAYRDLTPAPARRCISNMFGNLGDVWSALNSFLQGRGHDFVNTLGRVMFNTTVGLGGCIDVASMHGSRKIHNDFGITLGVWGLDSGPFLMLPLLGPSSVRDGAGTLGSFAAGASTTAPILSIENIPVRNGVLSLYTVNARLGLLDTEDMVNRVAIDRYSFIRDAYLQRRQAQVNGNNDALPDYGDDPGDDLPDYGKDPGDAAPAGNAPAMQP